MIVPTPKEKASVRAVIRMETAASAIHSPTRFSAGDERFVLFTAATIRNMLSVPTAKFPLLTSKKALTDYQEGHNSDDVVVLYPKKDKAPDGTGYSHPGVEDAQDG